MFLSNCWTNSLYNFFLPLCAVALLYSLATATKEIMKTHNEIKDRGRRKMFPVVETSFYYLCISCIVFFSPSEWRGFIIRFIYYFLYNLWCTWKGSEYGKEDFVTILHTISEKNTQQIWVCLHSFWKYWIKWLASMTWYSAARRDGTVRRNSFLSFSDIYSSYNWSVLPCLFSTICWVPLTGLPLGMVHDALIYSPYNIVNTYIFEINRWW